MMRSVPNSPIVNHADVSSSDGRDDLTRIPINNVVLIYCTCLLFVFFFFFFLLGRRLETGDWTTLSCLSDMVGGPLIETTSDLAYILILVSVSRCIIRS